MSEKCGFCSRGEEVEVVCGRLHSTEGCTAHHRCMQYSALLVQYLSPKFGGFKMQKVKAEMKRASRLKCAICKTKNKRSDQLKMAYGASAGCAWKRCNKSFHFYCARMGEQAVTTRLVVQRRGSNQKTVKYRVFCCQDHLNKYEKIEKQQNGDYDIQHADDSSDEERKGNSDAEDNSDEEEEEESFEFTESSGLPIEHQRSEKRQQTSSGKERTCFSTDTPNLPRRVLPLKDSRKVNNEKSNLSIQNVNGKQLTEEDFSPKVPRVTRNRSRSPRAPGSNRSETRSDAMNIDLNKCPVPELRSPNLAAKSGKQRKSLQSPQSVNGYLSKRKCDTLEDVVAFNNESSKKMQKISGESPQTNCEKTVIQEGKKSSCEKVSNIRDKDDGDSNSSDSTVDCNPSQALFETESQEPMETLGSVEMIDSETNIQAGRTSANSPTQAGGSPVKGVHTADDSIMSDWAICIVKSGEVTEDVESCLREKLCEDGIHRSHVYIHEFYHEVTVLKQHIPYLISNVVNALNRSSGAENLMDLLFSPSETTLKMYDQQAVFAQKYLDPDLKEIIDKAVVKKTQEQMDTLNEAANRTVVKMLPIESSNDEAFVVLLCAETDPDCRLRTEVAELVPMHALFEWNQGTKLHDYRSFSNVAENLHRYQQLEGRILRNWIKKSLREKFQVIRYPKEESLMTLPIRGKDSVTRTLKETLFPKPKQNGDDIVVFIGPVDPEIVSYRPYCFKTIQVVVKHKLTALTDIFVILDVDTIDGFDTVTTIKPVLPQYADVHLWSAFDPCCLPVTCVLMHISMKQGVPSSKSTIDSPLMQGRRRKSAAGDLQAYQHEQLLLQQKELTGETGDQRPVSTTKKSRLVEDGQMPSTSKCQQSPRKSANKRLSQVRKQLSL